MSIISLTPSRQFNLSASDVNIVKTSTDRDAIGSRLSRIWDSFVDMFCSTNRTEAKKCLFDVLSLTTPDYKKIESFHRLRELAGADFQHQFVHSRENGKLSYAIKLDNGDTCFSLSQNIMERDSGAVLEVINSNRETEDLAKVFDKDITRGDYYVEGDLLKNDSTGDDKKDAEDMKNALGAKLANLNCTDRQKESIVKICNQSTFGIIQALTERERTLLEQDLALPPSTERGGTEIVEYRINQDENGHILVKARSIKDIAASVEDIAARKNEDNIPTPAENEQNILTRMDNIRQMSGANLQKSIDTKIEILIDQNGNLKIKDLHYLCNKGEEEATA